MTYRAQVSVTKYLEIIFCFPIVFKMADRKGKGVYPECLMKYVDFREQLIGLNRNISDTMNNGETWQVNMSIGQ